MILSLVALLGALEVGYARMASAQLETGRAVIAGRVRAKADTIRAIAHAEVTIVGSRESRQTDDSGAFRFSGVYPGQYELRIRKIGYEQIVRTVTVGANEVSFRTLQMEVVPQVLREIRIAGRLVTVPRRYEDAYRRAAWGFGDFILREDIERRNPFDTKSLLEGIPGVHVSSHGVRFERCSDPFVPDNKIQVYVDGVQVTKMIGPDEALHNVHPLDIQLIEVYRGTSRIPAEFLADACAVIAIWTKSY